MAHIERRLAAIMLADIAGYSTLMERNESRTFQRVLTLRDEVTNPLVARYGGRIIKTTGDGFLAEFSSGTAALLCGIDIQRLNHAREAANADGDRIQMRIGLNLGDIIIDGDDVSGDGVNVAARLEPFAPKDGLCISGAVRDQVREDLDVVFEDLGEQQVKNIARPVRAYRIDLTGVPIPRPAVRTGKSSKAVVGAIVAIAIALAFGLSYWVFLNRDLSRLTAQSNVGFAGGDFAGIRIASALVIGNVNYVRHSKLENAGNDAIAIATALKLKGIPVTLKLNLNQSDLGPLVTAFKQQSTGDGVKFVFYAGHGWNLQNRNYLFPIDAPGRTPLLAGEELANLVAAEDIYKNATGKMIVLLDTHGDPVAVPDGVVLAFSGTPKNQTRDDFRLPDGSRSTNSPYAASVVEMLSGTEETLPLAFLHLSQRVGQKTEGDQIPWISASVVDATSWSTRRGKQ